MAGDTSMGRSRRLLTFRLDGDQRRRLKARLAGEGRTMSEVVILGLQTTEGATDLSPTSRGTGPLLPDQLTSTQFRVRSTAFFQPA